MGERRPDEGWAARRRDTWRDGVRVARLGAVALRAHPSLLVAVPLFAWLAEGKMRAAVVLAELHGASTWGSSWTWGALLGLALVASLAVHEAAHAAAGRIAGARIAELSLGLLVGCGHVEGMRWWGREAAVALAGPLVTLALGMACLAGADRLALEHFDARVALAYFGQAQIALGLVELVPSPPLDGGRVVQALLARRAGPARAAVMAARVGKMMAAAAAIAGTLGAEPMLVALAAVLWAGAEQSGRQAARAAGLDGLTVRGVLGASPGPPPLVDGQTTLGAVAARMQAEQAGRYLVVDDGRLAGVIDAADVGRVPPAERARVRARDMARPARPVELDGSAAEAGTRLRDSGAGILPVTDHGVLVAALTEELLSAATRLAGIGGWTRPPLRGPA